MALGRIVKSVGDQLRRQANKITCSRAAFRSEPLQANPHALGPERPTLVKSVGIP